MFNDINIYLFIYDNVGIMEVVFKKYFLDNCIMFDVLL